MAITAIRMLLIGMNRNVTIDAAIRPMIEKLDKDSYRTAWRMLIITAIALALTLPIAVLPMQSLWPQGLSIGFAILVTATSTLALSGMQRDRDMMEKTLQDVLG